MLAALAVALGCADAEIDCDDFGATWVKCFTTEERTHKSHLTDPSVWVADGEAVLQAGVDGYDGEIVWGEPTLAYSHLMYFTLFKADGTAATFVAGNADSSLLSWVILDDRIPAYPPDPSLTSAKDPTALWLPDGTCQYFAGGMGTLGLNHDADVVSETEIACPVALGTTGVGSAGPSWSTGGLSTSLAEVTCTWSGRWADASAPDGTYPAMMANGMDIPIGTVFYAQVQEVDGVTNRPPAYMASYLNRGKRWLPLMEIMHVDQPYEYGHIMDPGVSPFRSCFVMVYSTGIPV